MRRDQAASAIIALLGLVPWVILFYFYITFARLGYFLQDDFGFIRQYQDDWLFYQLFTFGNFGRFISRNVYWHSGYRLFGNNAEFFYLTNFIFILFIVFTSYSVARPYCDRRVSVVGSVWLLSSASFIAAFVWLSNSQHIIALAFLMWFVRSYQKFDAEERAFTWPDLVFLSVVFVLGILSNIFFALVLTLPLLAFVSKPAVRASKGHNLLIAFAAVLFCVFAVILSMIKAPVYATSLSRDVIVTNLVFYFGSTYVGVSLFVICAGAALWQLRAGKVFVAWVFMAPIVFYVPFAFLVHQRYVEYFSASMIFFTLSAQIVCSSLLRALRVRGVWTIAMLAQCLIVYWASPVMMRYLEEPTGAGVKVVVEQLQAFDRERGSEVNAYCFESEAPVNSSGVDVWDIPRAWWLVGFGRGLEVLVDPRKQFLLIDPAIAASFNAVPSASRCDVVFELFEDRVEVRNTSTGR